jgi:Leucine-rich repeat (LRR) protein
MSGKRVKRNETVLPLVAWQEIGQFAIRSLRDWHTLQRVNQTIKSAMRHPRVLSCYAFTLPDPGYTAKLGAMCAQIRQLRFNNCERTPFEPWEALPSLRDMYAMPKLEFLDLSGCNITGITQTVPLPSLKTLFLRDCDALDVSGLLTWPALTDITMTSCITNSTTMHTLAQLPNLECLSVCDTTCLWVGFHKFVNLTRLNLSGCAAHDLNMLQISNLVQLQSLSLANCDQLESVAGLEKLVGLVDLDLSNTDMTDIGPVSNLVNLEVLCLDSCRWLTSVAPLSQLGKLKTLYMSQCPRVRDIWTMLHVRRLFR